MYVLPCRTTAVYQTGTYIPNAHGGKLKSSNIICDVCNNKLSNIDKAYAIA
jgi:hypothetical protein